LIIFEEISKAYYEANKQRKLILDGFNFKINNSEKIIIFGASGSGKSTILNLLSGIDQPDSGRIIIDDFCINEVNEKKRTRFRRENIGFIFQNYNLIPTLNVLENVELVLELNQAEDFKFARELLVEVGLEHKLKAMPEELSGGEQQRVAVARSLVHKPKLLLADEATGNLDANTAKSVMEIIGNLHREYQPTTVMVTHDRSLKSFADKAVELEQGRLKQV
jgi:putative ABC transport system ATP-binding protein